MSQFIVFNREEFNRWWAQPSVGGTEHKIPVPDEVSLKTNNAQDIDKAFDSMIDSLAYAAPEMRQMHINICRDRCKGLVKED